MSLQTIPHQSGSIGWISRTTRELIPVGLEPTNTLGTVEALPSTFEL